MTYPRILSALRTLAPILVIGTLANACMVDGEALGSDSEELETCDFRSQTETCDQDEDPEMDGRRICFEDGDGFLEWGACMPHHYATGQDDCAPNNNWSGTCCMVATTGCCEDAVECNTPLVLSFDQRPVSFGSSAATFNLSRHGLSMTTDWPSADTPWLALDRNDNGIIDDGGELFGSSTRIGSDTFAENGFLALAPHDDNRDGIIDQHDAVWSQLAVWSDRDNDRLSSGSELQSVTQHGLVAIELAYHIAPRCDERGNCEVERARFWFYDSDGQLRSGAVSDVHLAAQ